MRLRTIRPIYWYVSAVCLVGLALGVAHAASGALAKVVLAPAQFWTFAILLLLGEMIPVKVPRRNEDVEISTSATFGFALVIAFGPSVAVVTHALATIAADLIRRKPWWKAAFNGGQYCIAITLGGAVLHLVTDVPRAGGPPAFGPLDLPAILAAAAVFFLVNHTLTQGAIALAQELPLVPSLKSDFAFQAGTAILMLALSPITVVAAERSLTLVPLLVLPMLSVYRSTTVWLEKQYKEHQALHDPLTGLPNRRLFFDRIGQVVGAAKRSRKPAAVMLIDLDRFKEINDTLGHAAGDVVLREIGARLGGLLRETDTIARVGGDEFALLLPHIPNVSGAIEVADRVLGQLEAPFDVDGLALDVDASIGIALFPEHGVDADTLMQRADIAMYIAKEDHAGYELYSAERDRHSARQLSLLGELRRAIDSRQFSLFYQPKVDTRTGQVLSVEGLLRWHHPQHGLMQPDDFIPLAEHTGLIRPLTLHVIELALSQCQEWNETGLSLRVAVNLSVRNLQDPDFPDEVARLLKASGLDPASLELEITETAVVDDPIRTLAALRALRDMGVVLSLDDFGAGYTSLASLKKLPIHEVKIDKAFIMNMTSDRQDALIVQSTIDLAQNLGLQVVAEGVETEDTWARLTALGCDLAQGNYLRPPTPPEELAEWLAMLGPIANGHGPPGNGHGPSGNGHGPSANGHGSNGNGRATGASLHAVPDNGHLGAKSRAAS